MPLTLLLDLDDTLLDSNMSVFAPAYFKKLAGFLSPWVESQELIREFRAGTGLMSKNEYSDSTLESVFNQYFYSALGMTDRTQLQTQIEHFYDDVFPSLKELSTPKLDVVEMVEYAFEKGWHVVIATNPIQPRKAVEHRLRWANLSPEKYPFALITSMESSHFSKAIPAYYSEILGKLGWPSGPVVMVGDDPILDIDSASKAGLPVFWVRPEGKSLPELADTPQGTMRDFHDWIQAVNFNLLQPNLKTPEALIASLQSTPAVLDSLLQTLNPVEWTTRPHKDEWALTEILCHLRDLDAEVNLPRLETLTVVENAFITGQNTDPWASERHYLEQDGFAAFHDFVAARIKLLEKLKSLSLDGWQRRGRHTIFGPTNLQELVGFMAEHDRTHIQQAIMLLDSIRKM